MRGNLHEQEGKVALPPRGAPVLDHRREKFLILFGPSGIRLALVPDDTLQRVRLQRSNHGIVKPGGALRRAGGIRGRLRCGWRVLAFRLGIGGCLLALGDIRIEMPNLRLILREDWLQFRVSFQRATRSPGFGWRAADGGVNQPHRHFQGAPQIATKEIGHGGKVGSGDGRTFLPMTGDIRSRRVVRLARHREQPQLRIARRGDGCIGSICATEFEAHVGLPAAQPNLAHKHVGQGD